MEIEITLDDASIAALADAVAARVQRPAADDYVDARGSGLGVRTFRRVAREGGFPVFQVGKKWVARRRDVGAWIESQRVDFDRAAPAAADPFDRALADGRLRRVK